MRFLNKIILGDSLQILKKIDADLIDLSITSPPYNKGEKHKGWLVKNVKYDSFLDKLSEKEYQEKQIEVLNEVYRITKPGGSFFYNHKLRWERGEMFHPMDWLRKTDWTIRQEIIWDRAIAANIRGWRFWQVDERIYWLYKSVKNNKIGKELYSKHALLTSIWRFPPERKNTHPAPFPLVLPARVIFSILNGGKGVVLDPYVGSGTTAVAAELLGSDYIGIDISKEYVNLSKKRLANVENERVTLRSELEKHIVNESFSERKENGKNVGKFRNVVNLPLSNPQNVLDFL
jgi:modification methylase